MANFHFALSAKRSLDFLLSNQHQAIVSLGAEQPSVALGLGAFMRGEVGPAGPEGPAGPPGGTSYVYSQGSASAFWTIDHALNRYPAVTVVDSTGREVEGDVEYVSSNRVTVGFAFPFAGQAFLS